MALQIRRGTEAQRGAMGSPLAQGELIYTTDQKDLWVGDGVTLGGTQIAPIKSITSASRGRLVGDVALTTDDIGQGSTNTYYTSNQAKVDAAAALVAGNATNSGITFSYNPSTHVINATVAGGTLTRVQDDANPALGGSLSLNSYDIDGTGNINITGNFTNSGTITASGIATFKNKLRIDGSNIGIVSGQNTVFFQNTRLEVISDISDTDAGIDIHGATNGNYTSTAIVLATSRGTVASPTIVQTGDALSGVASSTYNGSTYVNGAVLGFLVDSGTVTPGAASVPTKFNLVTTNGANSFVQTVSSGLYTQISADGLLTAPQIKSINSIQVSSSGGAISSATTFTTITGTSVSVAATYNNLVQSATSGSGFGAVFSVTKTGSGTSYNGATTITMVRPGIGYNIGDTVTIPGTLLGGTSTANDLTFTLSTYVVSGVGYSTGSGGAVTQATSKSTGVTLNKPTGTITMNNESLAAGAVATFTFTNGNLNGNDMVVINHKSGGTLGAYGFAVTPSLGSCTVYVRNNTGGSLAEAIVLQFAVIKSAVA